LNKHPTKRRRVEGQDAGVDTEQCILVQRFHVPVLEVEGLVQGGDRGVVDGRLVIRSISDREIGQSGNADGRRLSGRRRRNHDIWLWSGD
jgi:hypothetical protein